MNLTFKMTSEEYYIGWKCKRRMASAHQHYVLKSIIFAVMLIAAAVLLNMKYFVYIIAGMLIVTGIYGVHSEKTTVLNTFNFSYVLTGEHTIRVFNDGIELINSYEKIFSPWQNVFAVEETPEYIKILPTFDKGIAVISKKKYSGEALDCIMNTIKAYISVKEVGK